jgi:hypothetical protein
MNKIKWYQWAIVALIMFLTINSHFSTIIKSPSSTLFSAGGDGLKNYLTPLLHVKNSTSYNHFDSMNYPYGEHVLFTDNQPLISNVLRFFEKNFGEIAYHTTGVLNIALLLSLFLSGCLLYYMFRRLNLPHWYSLIVGITTAWLSPQLLRFGGHYALGYTFILLLLLYFLMGFEDRKWKWSYRILGLVFLAPMLHFYYFGISAVFLSFYYLIKVINDRKSILFYAKHWAIQLIIPFVFFNFIWLKIGNNVTDRPDSPSGFLHYVTVWEGSFFNPGSWWYDIINTYVTKIKPVNESESINYIGFAAVFFCIVRLTSWIFTRKLTIWEDEQEQTTEKNFLRTAFWASLLLYIFSTGVPFIFDSFEFLLAYVGPLKQFRGLGRFSWMFFFIINIVAFYSIYHWGNGIKQVEFRRLFWLIFIVIASREAIGNARKLNKPVNIYSELKTTGELIEDWTPFMDKNKYQAILPIPYYHLGAEYLGIEARGSSIAYNLFSSYSSELPCMGVMMSRTSWQQSLNSIPLGLEYYREPPVLRELPNQKPLLVMEYKIWHQEQGFAYRALLAKATKLHENQAFTLYELPIDAYRNVIAEVSAQAKLDAQNPKLFKNGGLLTKDSTLNFVYQNFDENQSNTRYRGNGAISFSNSEEKVIFNNHLPAQQKGKRYKLQFWLNIENGIDASTEFSIRELDKNRAQKFFWHHGCNHNIVALDGHWGLVSIVFEPQFDDTSFEIIVKNKNPKKRTIFLDELMINPEGNELYLLDNKEVMKNGRWYQ